MLELYRLECGAQFSLALSESGHVYTWGKGDYHRLGNGSDQHVRRPTLVEALRDQRVVDVAVGALHCLAVTDTGRLYAWGDNDHGQQGNGGTDVNQKPTLVDGFESPMHRVACGSSHSIAWCDSTLSQGNSAARPLPSRKEPCGNMATCAFKPLAFTTQLDKLGQSCCEDLFSSEEDAKADADRARPPRYNAYLQPDEGRCRIPYIVPSSVCDDWNRMSLSRMILSQQHCDLHAARKQVTTAAQVRNDISTLFFLP